MAEQSAETRTSSQIRSALVCRLRHRTTGRALSPTSGEVELENASSHPLEIEWGMHPFQHLNLLVTDDRGTTVSAWHYGNLFSPLGKIVTLRLGPGEKYTHNVSLLGNVPEERRRPGCYTVRAVYQYRDLKAVSDPVEVQL